MINEIVLLPEDFSSYEGISTQKLFVRVCKPNRILNSEYKISCTPTSIESLHKFVEQYDFKVVKDTINVQKNFYTSWINLEEKILVCYKRDGLIDVYCNERNEFFQKLEAFLDKIKAFKQKNKINILIKTNHGFELQELDAKEAKVNFNFYDTSIPLKDLEKNLLSSTQGLFILSGAPGTGKTYFLRHLISNVDLKFVFLTNETIANLSDPGFLSFATEELVNTVLIAEDAELCLMSRDKHMSAAASVLLNITDGLLGDLLKLRIITTVNNEEMVDKALLRKGRLMAKVEFNLLSVEHANKVLKKLGKKATVTEPTSLANLYNIDKDNGVKEKAIKIGF